MTDSNVTPIDGSLIAAIFFCAIDYWLSHRRGDMTPLINRAANAVWRVSPSDFLQIALLIVAVALVFPRDLEPKPHWEQRNNRRQNLARIGRALNGYRDRAGTFPPLYLADASGVPTHSWRVLLLPWFEYPELVRRYRLDEPWDGPSNIAFRSVDLVPYYSPAGKRLVDGKFQMQGCSHYLAVTGSETCWGMDRPIAPTLMVVECPESNVYWSEPRELTNPLELPRRIKPWYSMRSDSSYGRYALYSSGAVYFFRDGLPTMQQPVEQAPISTLRSRSWRWCLLTAELVALGVAAWQSRDLLRTSKPRRTIVAICPLAIFLAALSQGMASFASPLALGLGLFACQRVNSVAILTLVAYCSPAILAIPFAGRIASPDFPFGMQQVLVVLIPVAAIPLLPSLGTNKPRVGFYTLILALACLQPLGPW